MTKTVALLWLVVTALCVPMFGAQEEAASPPPISTKDAFLQFALDKAKTYSGALETAVTKAVDVAQEEAPALAREWIKWRILYHALHVAIPLVFIVVFGLIAWQAYRKANWGNYSWETFAHARALVAAALCGVSCVFAFFSLLVDDPRVDLAGERAHLYSLAQVIVAPRIYTIETIIDAARRSR